MPEEIDSKGEMTPQMEGVYRDATDNLIFLKSQQITVTNYAVLAYAAVIALSREQWLDMARDRVGLTILVLMTLFGLGFSLWFLAVIDDSMGRYRRWLDALYRDNFTEEQRRRLELERGVRRSRDITWGLGAITVLGFIVAIYALLRS